MITGSQVNATVLRSVERGELRQQQLAMIGEAAHLRGRISAERAEASKHAGAASRLERELYKLQQRMNSVTERLNQLTGGAL